MVDRRTFLVAVGVTATLAGCSGTGSNQPSCSSSSHFKLVDASFEEEPSGVSSERSRTVSWYMDIYDVAFENIGNQPAYNVEVEVTTTGLPATYQSTNYYSTQGVWDAGTRFQIGDLEAEGETESFGDELEPSDVSIIVSANLGSPSGQRVTEAACI